MRPGISERERELRRSERVWWWRAAIVLALTLATAAAFLLTSCTTYRVVAEAPVEFWRTVESLIAAVAADVWRLVELFL